jgi:thiamine-phosphate pyrophosphorylase
MDLNDSSEDGAGGWIPMWLYVKTIGTTGARSVLNMRKALLEDREQTAKAAQSPPANDDAKVKEDAVEEDQSMVVQNEEIGMSGKRQGLIRSWISCWRGGSTVRSPRSVSVFPSSSLRPMLAIITEPNACDTQEAMEATFEAIQQAVSTHQVDLVSVRLHVNNDDDTRHRQQEVLDRACILTNRLVQLSRQNREHEEQSSPSFTVVCSSDLVSVAVRAQAHGIHVKERHLEQIPEILNRFDYPIVIGTSAHGLESALHSYRKYKPHYYFVGTCYMTSSHPEKMAHDLEGPALPGMIQRALVAEETRSSTTATSSASGQSAVHVFAIGGIDETNCHEPISMGSSGVAVIRAILCAPNPAKIVETLHNNMKRGLNAKPTLT